VKGRDEIIGLRIVNIQTAMEVGTLKDVVLDPVSKGIAYYVLNEPSDYLGARLIDQKYAVGLGDFALTVMGEDIIEGVAHCPWAIELLKDDVQVIGTYALSDKGLLLGVVKQIFFDETTGSIVRCRIQNDEGRIFDIDGTDIVTLGGSFTILLEDSVLIEVEYIEGQGSGSAGEVGVGSGVRGGAEQDGGGANQDEGDSNKVGLDSDQEGVETNEGDSDRADLGSGKVGSEEKEDGGPKEGYGERGSVWRKEFVGQEAYRAAQHMSYDAAHNVFRDVAHTDSILQEDPGRYQEGTIGSEYAGSGHALEVSARPLSAAEAALVKAAETLRRKAAAEAAQERSIGPFHEAEVMNKDNKINKTNHVSKAHVNRMDPGLKCEMPPASEKDTRDICGADSFKSWGTVAKARKTESAAVDKHQHKDVDGVENRVTATDAHKEGDQKTDEDAKGCGGDGERLRNADVVRFPDNQGGKASESSALSAPKNRGTAEKSLAAAEIIYPRAFNHFDRRQMQYLLGKRLSQAVRLENGEMMREGEYITAEMLSLVRTRETLMELTVHIRSPH